MFHRHDSAHVKQTDHRPAVGWREHDANNLAHHPVILQFRWGVGLFGNRSGGQCLNFTGLSTGAFPVRGMKELQTLISRTGNAPFFAWSYCSAAKFCWTTGKSLAVNSACLRSAPRTLAMEHLCLLACWTRCMFRNFEVLQTWCMLFEQNAVELIQKSIVKSYFLWYCGGGTDDKPPSFLFHGLCPILAACRGNSSDKARAICASETVWLRIIG